MQGIELAREYYKRFGEPMLRERFAHLLPHIAVGLAGSGSECMGYDDEISRDHDFEPGFCIFLPEEDVVDRREAFILSRAYDTLPQAFMGFSRSAVSPVGGSRHGVIRTGDFLQQRLGCRDGVLPLRAWLSVPEQYLAEVIGGELFFDGSGRLTRLRRELSCMPQAVRAKKLAGELLLMGQAGQYNYSRCLRRGDTAAAQLAAYEFAGRAMHVAFLLEGVYMPYYKWQFHALRRLPRLGGLAEALEQVICTPNDPDRAEKKQARMEEISARICACLRADGLSDFAGDALEGHAYAVNRSIRDEGMRNLHVLAAVQ